MEIFAPKKRKIVNGYDYERRTEYLAAQDLPPIVCDICGESKAAYEFRPYLAHVLKTYIGIDMGNICSHCRCAPHSSFFRFKGLNDVDDEFLPAAEGALHALKQEIENAKRASKSR